MISFTVCLLLDHPEHKSADVVAIRSLFSLTRMCESGFSFYG